jgi:hypothetical protein
VNLSAAQVTARISFRADSGGSLILPLVFPQGNTTATTSFVDVLIGPAATFIIETEAATASIYVGWAEVQGSGPLAGYSVFRLRSPGGADLEGTVPLDSRGSSSIVLSFDNTGGFQTGMALANQASTSANITLTLRDENGTPLLTSQLALPGLGHGSFFLSSIFPISSNQRGIVEMHNPSGGITGVGLRFSPSGSFTSMPLLR